VLGFVRSDSRVPAVRCGPGPAVRSRQELDLLKDGWSRLRRETRQGVTRDLLLLDPGKSGVHYRDLWAP